MNACEIEELDFNWAQALFLPSSSFEKLSHSGIFCLEKCKLWSQLSRANQKSNKAETTLEFIRIEKRLQTE